jgi:diguanylate cyclase (GGDEF)-like protein
MLTAPLQPTKSLPINTTARLKAADAATSDARRAGGRRLVGVAACLALSAWAVAFEHLNDPALLPLFLFFAGLSLLSVLFPATGPRGRRVGLIPAVGLAAVLLLPPLVALLPLLLANTAYAFSRDMPLLRRGAYERGLWLILAVLAGGLVHSVLHGPRPWDAPHTPLELALVTLTYGGVYVLGRLFGLGKHLGAGRTVRRHAWAGWRLEAVTLAATAPVAFLMALSYPVLGLTGVGGAAALLALMLVIAHFGFEVAGLHDQVRAMEKISAVSVSQTSAAKVIERFLQLSGGLVSCDRTALWLTDDAHTRLERITAAPARPDLSTVLPVSVRFGEGLVGRVAERKMPLLVRDGARDPRLTPSEQRRREADSFSIMLLPLVAGDETVGVVQFERDAPGTFTGRDLARVRALANQTAATIANVHSHRDVYNQAVTDSLTGLYNRRHMQEVLLDERRRAHRYGHPLSVIMLDVDSFKTYNDTYGHVQGDVLLRMAAAILRENVRDVDIVGRYGGEEFIVVLPETPSAEAYQTAERLRQAVARTVFPGFPADPDLAVFKTISLGVAAFPDTTDDTQALVTLADNALYRAKRGGRNQTVMAGA